MSALETFYPANKAEWRNWLAQNHATQQSIWVIFYRKKTGIPSLSWSEAVDEAICFGWIDSTKKSIDEEKYRQLYSKRNPKSTWSKVNKDKVKVLMEQDLIQEAGYKTIEIAKENGNWSLLDDVENLIIPKDLDQALKSNPKAEAYFLSLSKSNRKSILQWVVTAKRSDTRIKRINETVELSAQGLKPKQFR
ncbi:YdeI/OmpD-associated family protein [Brumimicrobium aurantiacum]|uniref:Bacteriocin-protection protein n=1 Tax=Brumimicrobium aurantiacum TaxID=1737063 RepID=A0A3E1EVV3_9FLAO|nr:YdeI/OmpD-associated family protein [Brumimicrobium aurantiacum]RFC53652.1 hypothetical protein DXU93_11010 [Brumimicrobium aurantiacum]